VTLRIGPRKEHRLVVFETGYSGYEREEVGRGWIKLHTEELHFTKYQNGPNKRNEMDRACRTRRGDAMCIQNFNRKTRRKEGLRVARKVTLKFSLKKQEVAMRWIVWIKVRKHRWWTLV
jgi:hypothetical protein